MEVKKLLTSMLAFLTLAYSAPIIARAANVEEKENGKVYMVHSFSDMDKRYIKAGKTPEVKKELDFLLNGLSKEGYKGSLNDLIDGKDENNEFKGLYIDETDSFNPSTSVMYKDKNEELKGVSRSGIMDGSNRMFLEEEIGRMNNNIKDGLNSQSIYQALNSDEIKERMTQTLDVQAGKIEGASSRWDPRYENQMGFGTEDEFRDILSKTKSISIEYDPHDSKWNLTNGNDFKIVYNLNNDKNIVKYVSNFPLSILEDTSKTK